MADDGYRRAYTVRRVDDGWATDAAVTVTILERYCWSPHYTNHNNFVEDCIILLFFFFDAVYVQKKLLTIQQYFCRSRSAIKKMFVKIKVKF